MWSTVGKYHIEFIPVGQQKTKVINFFGDENYKIDLSKGDDLFTKVIELRSTVKKDRKKHPKGSAEYERLDAMQLALKLIANATSYGVLVEVVVDERSTKVPCMVYHGGEVSQRAAKKPVITEDAEFKSGFKVETPGKYFAPFGGLIPAAGRLLLAVAETLFHQRAMSFMYCDTDSLCPARPANMSREEFRKRVLEVAGPNGWFQPLSPYSDGEPLFALEDVNYRLRDYVSGEVIRDEADPLFGLEPLYCLAISAKRYVLFNLITWAGMGRTQTVIVIRKISGHGLGALRHLDDYNPDATPMTAPDDVEELGTGDELDALPPMDDYEPDTHPLTAPEHIAAPIDPDAGKRNYGALVHGPSPRMLCDIWRIVIGCFLEGKQNKIDEIISVLPQLQVPQYTQLTLSSSHLMNLYPKLPGRRGFQFFSTFPTPKCEVDSRYVKEAPFDEHKALCKTTLYASVPEGGVTPELIEEWKRTGTGLFRRDNNEFPHGLFDPAWKLKLQTVADKLRGYFYHEEIKSSGDVGQLRPKVVVSLDKHFIGKETSPLDDDNEDTQDDVPITTSSDLVLRSKERNSQPVMNIELDDSVPLAEAFSKLKEGKHLTFDDMKELKANLEFQADGDGDLQPRYLKMETEALAANDPVWSFRIKTWERLKKFGRFEDISKLSNISMMISILLHGMETTSGMVGATALKILNARTSIGGLLQPQLTICQDGRSG
jgi:hypothetical protein